MYPGFFINFEGIDGTGKTTQTNLLAAALKKQGQTLYITKEPGDAKSGSNVGSGIRAMLFGTPGTKNVGPGVADLLFLADHLQNTYDIRQALKLGKVVLSDRYADSQFAYSASSSKKAPRWANQLFVDHFGPTPDLTVLFVVRGPNKEVSYTIHEGSPIPIGASVVEDISWALARANARRGVEAGKQDGKAWNDVEEQRKIQNAYLDLLSNQNRTALVNIWETSTVDEIHSAVLLETLSRMNNRGTNPQMDLPITAQEAA